jgi:AraC-like DNA-binding protein
MVISGKRNYTYSNGKKIVEKIFKPQDVLAVMPYGWTFVKEKNLYKHKTLSIVFHEEYLRIVQIEEDAQKRLSKQISSFHTSSPPSQALQHMLNSLHAMSFEYEKNVIKQTAEIILYMTKQQLENERQQTDNNPTNYLLNRIKNYIDENLHLDLDRDIIAKEFNLNSNYISQLFCKSGERLIDYINSKKLEKAEFYLQATNLTINEIAYKCGFNYTNYFIRVFKEKYKITPSAYRKYDMRISINNKQ